MENVFFNYRERNDRCRFSQGFHIDLPAFSLKVERNTLNVKQPICLIKKPLKSTASPQDAVSSPEKPKILIFFKTLLYSIYQYAGLFFSSSCRPGLHLRPTVLSWVPSHITSFASIQQLFPETYNSAGISSFNRSFRFGYYQCLGNHYRINTYGNTGTIF